MLLLLERLRTGELLSDAIIKQRLLDFGALYLIIRVYLMLLNWDGGVEHLLRGLVDYWAQRVVRMGLGPEPHLHHSLI